MFFSCSAARPGYHQPVGHNQTARKRASVVLASALADFAGWHMTVDCGGRDCPRGRVYDVAQLATLSSATTVCWPSASNRALRTGSPTASRVARIQIGKVVEHGRTRESEPKWRPVARSCRNEQLVLHQRRRDACRLPLARAEHGV